MTNCEHCEAYGASNTAATTTYSNNRWGKRNLCGGCKVTLQYYNSLEWMSNDDMDAHDEVLFLDSQWT